MFVSLSKLIYLPKLSSKAQLCFHSVPFFFVRRKDALENDKHRLAPKEKQFSSFPETFLMLLSVFMFCHEAFAKASRNQRKKTSKNDLLPVPIPKTFRESIARFFDENFPKNKTRRKVAACFRGSRRQMQFIAMRFEWRISRSL